MFLFECLPWKNIQSRSLVSEDEAKLRDDRNPRPRRRNEAGHQKGS